MSACCGRIVKGIKMKTIEIKWLVCAALAMTASAQVTAQSSNVELYISATPARHGGAVGAVGLGNPVASASLAKLRGGTEVVNNDMRLAGTTAGNSALNVATGSNAISAGAFANMSGLPVVIQNSGANVLIQNAVILNLQIN
jgi:hypothetical protein